MAHLVACPTFEKLYELDRRLLHEEVAAAGEVADCNEDVHDAPGAAECAAHGLDLVLKGICFISTLETLTGPVRNRYQRIYKHHSYLALSGCVKKTPAASSPLKHFTSQLLCLTCFGRPFSARKRVFVYKFELRQPVRPNARGDEELCNFEWLNPTLFANNRLEILQKCKALIRDLWPIFTIPRNVDTGEPKTHFFYHQMSDTRNRVMEVENDGMHDDSIDSMELKSASLCVMLAGKDTLHAPIHGDAYALNAQHIDQDLEDAGERKRKTKALIFRNYLKQIKHVSELGKISKHECYEAESEKAKALGELSRWRNQQLEALKDIAKKRLLKQRESVEAWRGLRDNLPLLSRIAKRVLSQPVAASACEQIWSILDFFNPKSAAGLVRV